MKAELIAALLMGMTGVREAGYRCSKCNEHTEQIMTSKVTGKMVCKTCYEKEVDALRQHKGVDDGQINE